MMIFRFLLAIIFLKLFDEGYAFLLDRRHTYSSAGSMKLFDFSSAVYWDDFYNKTENQDQMASQDGSSSTESTTTAATATEWHPSVSLEDIASVVPPNGKCLIIGCGNSNLPDVILKQRNRILPSSLVLLDTSQTCLNQLRERHERMDGNGEKSQVILSNTEVDYVCGDVTKLSNYFGVDNDVVNGHETGRNSKNGRDNGNEEKSFDMIIDKGLTDAILCGEGWDGPLEKLLDESAKVLSMETGQYLLISYNLPSSTKRFLVEVGDKVGLKWDFEYDLVTSTSHDGVSVAMARKIDPTATIS